MFACHRLWAGAVVVCALAAPAAWSQALIIDHTCTDLSQVPPYWIDQAKLTFFATYGHTSHGSQLVSGMRTLNGVLGCACSSCADPGCPACQYGFCDDWSFYTYGGSNPQAPVGTLSFCDNKPPGASDLGNPDRTAWETATRNMLTDPRYAQQNLVMWSWCGQADTTPENIDVYLNLMQGLRNDYPDVVFVYMTGHLNGTGVTGNLHQRNEQIRAHVLATGGVLFDFADIESYDPDGNAFLHLNANDGCYYYVSGQQHNWADEWCAAHPDSDLCATCSCAHSKPLNCNLKGRAVWWMLARLAGWPGPQQPATCRGDSNCDGAINWRDLDYFVAAMNDNVGAWTAMFAPGAPTCPFANNDVNADGTVSWRDIDPLVAVMNTTCP